MEILDLENFEKSLPEKVRFFFFIISLKERNHSKLPQTGELSIVTGDTDRYRPKKMKTEFKQEQNLLG